MELQFRTKTDCLIRRGSKENKDDRVESIFAESHCETACPQGKHSNVGKFPFEKETFPMLDIISLRKKVGIFDLGAWYVARGLQARLAGSRRF